MKRAIVLLFLAALLVSCGPAKNVSYVYKPLSAEGCEVSYSALQEDGQLYVIVTIRSDRLVFNDTPF